MPIFDTHTYLEGHLVPGINQDAGQVKRLLHSRGIERAIVMSTRAAKLDPLSGNRILKAMIEPEAGLYACLVAHLNRVDLSIQAIRDLLGSKRFVGIMLTSSNPRLPLHPIAADEALNACRRYQKPIFLATPNAACVEVALHLAKAYSMHKFVFLGMGGVEWRSAVRAADQSVNIFLETSDVLDRAKIPAAIETIGSHRILFGSGMPGLDPAAALGLIADSDLSPNDQRRILHENAYRLFNLQDIEG